jgi:hypothetical protein
LIPERHRPERDVTYRNVGITYSLISFQRGVGIGFARTSFAPYFSPSSFVGERRRRRERRVAALVTSGWRRRRRHAAMYFFT